jgi:hypothetical protein
MKALRQVLALVSPAFASVLVACGSSDAAKTGPGHDHGGGSTTTITTTSSSQPAPDGASCETDSDCASGVCASVEGVCGAQPFGSLCAYHTDCASGDCEDTCVQGKGQTCSDAMFCDDAFICYGGTCQPPHPDGQPCQSDEDCANDVCVNGTCGALADGSACTMDAECQAAICEDGVCGRRANGAACVNDWDCASLICEHGVCEAQQADGTSCVRDVDCTSNWCDSGVCTTMLANGAPCTSAALCESSICTGGQCVCAADGLSVLNTAGCCSGFGTASADGTTAICGECSVYLCTVDADCCSGTCDTSTYQCQ